MKKLLLTEEALAKLNRELEEFVLKRKVITAEIKLARSFGDLSENAEYHAAREAQSFNEAEIVKTKSFLENYELVNTDNIDVGTATLNSDVEFKFVGDDTLEKVKIVTRVDADPMNSLISNESPIGAAILGHRKGEFVNCQTPNGVSQIEIISVTHD